MSATVSVSQNTYKAWTEEAKTPAGSVRTGDGSRQVTRHFEANTRRDTYNSNGTITSERYHADNNGVSKEYYKSTPKGSQHIKGHADRHGNETRDAVTSDPQGRILSTDHYEKKADGSARRDVTTYDANGNEKGHAHFERDEHGNTSREVSRKDGSYTFKEWLSADGKHGRRTITRDGETERYVMQDGRWVKDTTPPSQQPASQSAREEAYLRFQGGIAERQRFMHHPHGPALGSQMANRKNLVELFQKNPGLIGDMAKNGDLSQMMRFMMHGSSHGQSTPAVTKELTNLIKSLADDPVALGHLNAAINQATQAERAAFPGQAGQLQRINAESAPLLQALEQALGNNQTNPAYLKAYKELIEKGNVTYL